MTKAFMSMILLSTILKCDDPFMFFHNETERCEGPLDQMFVYDTAGGLGKSLRVTDHVAAFGAAKVSGLFERRLANRSWELQRGSYVIGTNVLKEIKTRDLSELHDEGQLGRFVPAGSRNVTNLMTRISSGSLADIAVGGRDSVFKLMLNSRQNGDHCIPSALWDEVGVEPPTFVSLKLDEVEEKITTDVVARTFCSFGPNTNILSGKILLNGCNGFYSTVLEGSKKGIEASEDYEVPPLVSVDYGEILSRHISTNALLRPCLGRFDYEKSRAGAWLVAMNDANVVQCDPHAYNKNVEVTYTREDDLEHEQGIDETILQWSTDEDCYKIHFSNELSFKPKMKSLSIVTNYVYEDYLGTIVNEISEDARSYSALCAFSLVYSLSHDNVKSIIPNDGLPHNVVLEKNTGDHSLVDIYAIPNGQVVITKQLDGMTNMSLVVQSKRTGKCRYTDDSKSVRVDEYYSKDCKVSNLPEWIYEKGFVKSSYGYFLSRHETMLPDGSIDLENSFRSIRKYDTSSGNTYEMWLAVMDNVIKQVEVLQERKSRCNLRDARVGESYGSSEMKETIEGDLKIYPPRNHSLSGTYSYDGENVYINGNIFMPGENVLIFVPMHETIAKSEPATNFTARGTIYNKTKCIYNFRNLQKTNEGE